MSRIDIIHRTVSPGGTGTRVVVIAWGPAFGQMLFASSDCPIARIMLKSLHNY
jgi:hypothetical protein